MQLTALEGQNANLENQQGQRDRRIDELEAERLDLVFNVQMHEGQNQHLGRQIEALQVERDLLFGVITHLSARATRTGLRLVQAVRTEGPEAACSGVSTTAGLSYVVGDYFKLSLGVQLTKTHFPRVYPPIRLVAEVELFPETRIPIETVSPFFRYQWFAPRGIGWRQATSLDLNPHESQFETTEYISGFPQLSWGFYSETPLLVPLVNKENFFIAWPMRQAFPDNLGNLLVLHTKFKDHIFLRSRFKEYLFKGPEYLRPEEPGLEKTHLVSLSRGLGDNQIVEQIVGKLTSKKFNLVNFLEYDLGEVIRSFVLRANLPNVAFFIILSITALTVYIYVMTLQVNVKNKAYKKLLGLIQVALAPLFLNAFTICVFHVILNTASRRNVYYKVNFLQKLIDHAQQTASNEITTLTIYGRDYMPALSLLLSASTMALTVYSLRSVALILYRGVSITVCMRLAGYLVVTVTLKHVLFQWAISSPPGKLD